jgi:hypothetical protein
MDLKARDPIPQTYLDWFKADLRHAEEWRKEAQTDYDFRDGRQWSDTDKAILEDQGRPPIVFNRVGAIIDAVSGQEISNRQEVRYIPRVSGPAKRQAEQPPPMGHNGGPPMGGPPGPMPPPEMAGAPPGMPPQMGGGGGMAPPGPPPMEDTGGDQESTDLLTSAALWFRDQADADDNDSEAFRDTITGGMGWTETRLDYEDNPDGTLKDDRLDPFEMVWDYNARKNNLVDATRVWRVRCLPIEEARAFVSGFVGEDGERIEVEDEDLHAAWAANAVWDGKSEPHQSEAVRDRLAGRRAASGELQEAVIVHCQWIEREDVWRVPMPGPDGKPVPTDLSATDYDAFKAKGKENGVEITPEAEKAIGIRKRKKKVRYQAFLGNIVLKVMPTACPDHFNFKCITGKRDQTKGQFFGLVRNMRDPQSWSNKLYSQILHIINSQAKGGILAERGAFDNDTDAQESWARTDRITWVKNGKLSGANPAWAPKPVAQVPPALQYLMDVANTGIHQVSGVNMELLGMREADQAGVLEYQRRQAGLTILQPIFDNLKAYRREQGELILWYIQNDLSDGRLVRIVGKQEAEYLPLAKQATLEYDIIVDDMPSSPNQKEKNWQLITQMMPFIKDMMTPEVALALAEDSPLPAATVQKLQKLAEKASESPAAQMQQKMAELEAAVLETKAMLQSAQAEKAKADAQAAMNQQPVDPQAELAIKEAEAQGKLAIKQQEVAGNLEMKRAETEANIGLQREKQQGDFALRSQQAQQDAALSAQSASQDMALKERTTEADLARADKTTSADIALKNKQAKAAANRPKPKPAK